jgi:hypothetical protein
MILIPIKDIQSFLFKVIWLPEVLMIFFTLLFFILMLIVALLIRFAAIFIKNRVYLIDTITISIWCGLPFIIILPFSIILVKILVNFPSSIWLISSLLIFISIWVLLRILRAISVVFDKPQTIINTIGGIILFVFLGLPITIYQLKYQFFDYIKYIFNVIIGI